MSWDELDDALIDGDGDEIINRDERIVDTDPTNGTSFFCITNAAHASPSAAYFNSSTGRVYVLQGVTNLVDGVWTNVPRGGDVMDDMNRAPCRALAGNSREPGIVKFRATSWRTGLQSSDPRTSLRLLRRIRKQPAGASQEAVPCRIRKGSSDERNGTL